MWIWVLITPHERNSDQNSAQGSYTREIKKSVAHVATCEGVPLALVGIACVAKHASCLESLPFSSARLDWAD